jgi:predicted permease
VLLLVCVNVASIMMARATLRQREMAVRTALGASRIRLVRQMLTETMLLALFGGVVGILLGGWASGSLSSLLPKINLPLRLEFYFDWRVAAYSLATVLFAGIVVGLWPALSSARANPGEVLHDGGRSDSAGFTRHRTRSVLVILQVAGSLTLLIVGALFVRSLSRAQRMYLGFDPQHVAYVMTDPHLIGYDDARTKTLYRELEDKVRALPGVESVSLSINLPLGLFSTGRRVTFEGRPLALGEQPPLILFDAVDPAYFGTMRVPLLRGRAFSDSDGETSRRVAIVNQTMADNFWPGEDAIGKRFGINADPGQFFEIVGVAGNGAYNILGEKPQPYFYLPLAQSFSTMQTIAVRASVPLNPLLVQVQREIRSLSPELPILDAETMEQSLAGLNGYFVLRLGATMAGIMGFLGLALAVVGVYGVVSFSVAQRTREIGIRMALGASRRDILKFVLRQGLTIVIAGVVVGLICGWALTHAMGRFAAGPADAGPFILGGAALLLASIALVACWIPARRAMRVDPMVALRYE